MLVPSNEDNLPKERSGPVRISIFGSTGSIGSSALELVRAFPDRFQVVSLVAGSDIKKLAAQIREFSPRFAAVSDPALLPGLKSGCGGAAEGVILCAGEDDITDLAGDTSVDVMLAAIVGMAGLKSVLKSLEKGITVALANKESLVAAGALVSAAVKESGARLIPVDSEHSAIFQLLQGVRRRELKSITLTASGGPFLHTDPGEFKNITPQQAIKHPKWSMGPKISVDSATMFNKALELIEAHWLFGLPPESIGVLVHPQSIVHSLVNFTDGSSLAQASNPDMKQPISYALNYPGGRLPGIVSDLDLARVASLEFYEVDHSRFPAVEMAREALRAGGAASAVLNIANEIAVDRFLKGNIGFDTIPVFVRDALDRFGSGSYSSVEDLTGISRQIAEL